MKTKNKKELVKRAVWHSKNDHITQGTYGESHCDGFIEFKGCAIGCLATPHTKKGLKAFIQKLGNYDEYNKDWTLKEGDEEQLVRLKKKFGISTELARVVEGIFESLTFNGEAINFIPQFAKALPEGVDIKPTDIRKFWSDANEDTTIYMYGVNYVYGDNAEKVRDEFLKFLRSYK